MELEQFFMTWMRLFDVTARLEPIIAAEAFIYGNVMKSDPRDHYTV